MDFTQREKFFLGFPQFSPKSSIFRIHPFFFLWMVLTTIWPMWGHAKSAIQIYGVSNVMSCLLKLLSNSQTIQGAKSNSSKRHSVKNFFFDERADQEDQKDSLLRNEVMHLWPSRIAGPYCKGQIILNT